MNKKSLIITVVGLFVAVFVGAAWLYDTNQQEEKSALATANSAALIKFHSPRAGNPNAKVTIVEFMDPACETCAQFHPFVKQLMKKYKDKVNLVVRYAPFHDGSDVAVKILESARKQGTYWGVLELMYESQQGWASHHHPQPEKLWEYLEHYKFDVAKIKQGMDDPTLDKLIAIDLADAKILGVNKTPSFFVNGKPLPSFGFQQLEDLIASEIAANY